MDDAVEETLSLPSSSAPSDQAPPEPGASAKPKGTGVFFGPALASRLAGSRSGGNSKQKPRQSQSFAGRASAPGSADAQNPEGNRHGLPSRRASASLELSLSPTVSGSNNARRMLAGRSSSFTAASGSGGMRNGFAPAGSTAQFRSSCHSMPGGPADVTLYQLISSPHPGLPTPAGRASMPYDAANLGNNMPPAQRMHLLQQQQQQQVQQQQAMQSDAVHLQQEIQQLQAQLQQLLLQQQQQQPQQQQQVCSNHQTAGQQPLQLVNTLRSSTGGMGLLLPGDSSPSPDLLAQLQALRQPAQQLPGASMGGALSQQASAQRPFASLSCLPDASQQQGGLSISALGGPMGTDLSTACGLPVLQNADLAAQLAQAQQLQAQAQMPTLQEGPRGLIEEDDGQVAALDGMIDQCLSRLLQLRSQITARRAAAVPMGSSCSTPTATPAAAGAASAQVLSSAGFTSESLLQGVSQPLLLTQQVQQQHSGMLSPVSSMHGHMPAAQQQLGSSSNLLWGQQQPPGPVAGNSVMLSTALGPACQALPQGSSCIVAGTYNPQPMPLLNHLQAQLTVLGQQQQVLMQPADMQLTASFGGGGDGGRGSHGGNFNTTTGANSQQMLLQQQIGQQTATLQQQQQPQMQLDMQQLQQLQQLLAQQELKEMTPNSAMSGSWSGQN